MKSYFAIAVIILFIGQASFAVESIYNQAMEAFNSGNYNSAVLLFRRVMERSDDYRDRAWFHLSLSYYRNGKYNEALFEFSNFLTECSTPELCHRARFWIGECHYLLKQYSRAIEEYKRYLTREESPDLTARAYSRLGTIYYMQDRYDESIIEWKRAVESSTDRGETTRMILGLSRSLFANGDHNRAIDRLSPLVNSDAPMNIRARAALLLGRLYLKKENYDLAIDALSTVPESMRKEQAFADVYYYLARARFHKGEREKSRDLVDIFLVVGKQSSRYREGQFLMAKLLEEKGETTRAVEIYRDLSRIEDNYNLKVEASQRLARLQLENSPSEAYSVIKRLLENEKTSDKRELLILAGRASIRMGEYEQADSHLQAYVSEYQFEKNLDQVYLLLARSAMGQGRVDKALTYLDNVEKENPFSKLSEETGFFRALIEYKKENYEASLKQLERMIELNPPEDLFPLYRLQLECYIKLERLQQARRTSELMIDKYLNRKETSRALYQFILKLEEKRLASDRYVYLVITHFPETDVAARLVLRQADRAFERELYEQASKNFSRYREMEQGEHKGHAFIRILQSEYRLGNYTRVLKMTEEERIPPMDEESWRILPRLKARSAFKLEQYSRVYRQMLGEDLSSWPVEDIYRFVVSAVKTGDTVRALQAYSLLPKEKEEWARAGVILARALTERGEDEAAIDICGKILKKDVDAESEARCRLLTARLLIKRHDYTEARETLSSIPSENEFEPEKDLLILEILLGEKKIEEASRYYLENRKSIVRAAGWPDSAIKIAEHVAEEGDITRFNIMVADLRSFQKYQSRLNLYRGRLYFNRGAFHTAYTFYSRVEPEKGIPRAELHYRKGIIQWYYYKNRKRALTYLESSASTEEMSPWSYRAMIDLSLIALSEGKNRVARAHIRNILESDYRGIHRQKAETLEVMMKTQTKDDGEQ